MVLALAPKNSHVFRKLPGVAARWGEALLASLGTAGQRRAGPDLVERRHADEAAQAARAAAQCAHLEGRDARRQRHRKPCKARQDACQRDKPAARLGDCNAKGQSRPGELRRSRGVRPFPACGAHGKGEGGLAAVRGITRRVAGYAESAYCA